MIINTITVSRINDYRKECIASGEFTGDDYQKYLDRDLNYSIKGWKANIIDIDDNLDRVFFDAKLIPSNGATLEDLKSYAAEHNIDFQDYS